jgi:hypothetical protein
VLVVGAGAGDGPWVQWLQSRGVASDRVPVLLVEGDEQQYQHLQHSLPAHAGWALRRDVVAASSGKASFHRASNPAEGGLLEPESLQQMWPHLRTAQSVVIEDAVTLDALDEEVGGGLNWLVLDCLPAGSLLQGGPHLLTGLDVGLVRVVAGGAGQGLPTDLLAGEQAVDELLNAAGLRCIHTEAERHPALAHALYVRDGARQAEERAQKLGEQLKVAQEAWAKEKAELTHAREVAGQKVQGTEQAKALAQEEAQKLGEQLKLAQQAWAKEKAELTHAMEAAGQKARDAEQAKARAQEQAKKLGEQLKVTQANEKEALTQAREAAGQKAQDAEQAKALAQELGELKLAQEVWAKEKAELTHARKAAGQKVQAAEQAKALAQEQAHGLQAQQLEAYQQSIKNLEKELRANFSKDLGNAVKQIEAFVSIQNYLNAGDTISGFHGWPISPDVGLFLIEHIRERRYDLIIEFGSGVSTALFAKALQIQQRAAVSQPKNSGKKRARLICSFEHDQIYLRKTRDMLESQGLTGMVSLNHAPLMDWQDDTGRYLHYDCDATLAALGRQLAGSRKRVLVLVDGPPGATCVNARYPAVPKIFKHLARHEIDVVLDDTNRHEEKAIIELWRAFWKQRSMRVKDSTVPSEKGLFWARNYDE